MNLIEIKNSRRIFEVIWTYNLCMFGNLDKLTWKKAENILVQLLEQLMNIQETKFTQEDIQMCFNKTVCDLENLLHKSPLDDGIYEYGGLNCLFVEIMQTLGFSVKKEKHYWKSDFVYGKDFEDDKTSELI